ncbi:MAG: Ig-like domain-containing protein [Acidimicrobiales bacterium]
MKTQTDRGLLARFGRAMAVVPLAIGILFGVLAGVVAHPATSSASSAPQALILDTTVTTDSVAVPDPTDPTCPNVSVEECDLEDSGWGVTVVDGSTWDSMTAAEFSSYQLIVLGDPTCGSSVGPSGGTPAELAAAVSNESTWAPIVDGSVIIIGTDPIFHYEDGSGHLGAGVLVSHGLAYAGAQTGETGLYLDLSCYYNNGSSSPMDSPILDGLEAGFTVFSANGCTDSIHVVASAQQLLGLTDDDLSNWSCSVHEYLGTWPSDFVPFALDTSVPGTVSNPLGDCPNPAFVPSDGTSAGCPYIVARGGGISEGGVSLAGPSGSATIGSLQTLTASVELNGSGVGGASVVFTCVSGPNVGSTTTLTTADDGTVPYSYTSTSAGTDSWTASYTPSDSATETSSPASVVWTLVGSTTVGTVNDAATSAAWSGSEVTESSAYDTSAVTLAGGGTPTGTVAYSLFDNGTCAGDPADTQTVDLSDGIVPNSADTAALVPGAYSYDAAYSGDGNDSPSDSGCQPFSVLPAATSTGTAVSDNTTQSTWSGTEVTGASAYATADVTAPAGPTASGMVGYSFFENATCSGSETTGDSVMLLGNGSVPASTATAALAAGSYSFDATYFGDSNYLGSTSACEPFVVSPASSATANVVDDAGQSAPWSGLEVTGAAADDTSSVTGVPGFTPSGSVVYSFFENDICLGVATSTSTVTLNLNGSVPASAETGPLGAGFYSFVAHYSGDANNRSSVSACAPFSVGVAPSVTVSSVIDAVTSGPWSGSEITGATAYDTSTVSGLEGFTPTGSVDYSLFGNDTCSGDPVLTDTVTMSAGAVPASSTSAPLAAGSYSYESAYSGDADYSGSTNGCASFDVGPATPTTGATVYDAGTNSPWSGTEETGASAYDTSAVTGLEGFTPTGTLAYSFFANTVCSGEPYGEDVVTLAAGVVPRSPATAPLAAGSYSYKAAYSGDGNYLPAASGCLTFTVAAGPEVTTAAINDGTTDQPWSGTEVTGATAYGSSTVTGAPGVLPTGTVTYDLFENATCAGNAAITSVETLTGNGSVPTSSSSPALAAGSYSFTATYSGDASYVASASDCGTFSVGKAPAATTTVVNDSTTHQPWTGVEMEGASAFDTSLVGGLAGFTPSGTITYNFFKNSTCTGTASSTQSVGLVSGLASASHSTGALPAGSYAFRAAYGGDSNYVASAGACEAFAVRNLGYRLVGADGGVFDFGTRFYGSGPSTGLHLDNVVGMATTSAGYWLVESNGGVVPFGNARSHGSLLSQGKTVTDIVGMAATADGGGYWLVGADGTVYPFGDAVSRGSLSSRGVHVKNIVAISSPDSGGYWLIGSDGSVWRFGDAQGHGYCPAANSGCQGVTNIVAFANVGQSGYFLVSRNGRVFGFGTAHFHGSCVQPGSACVGTNSVVGIASPDAGGYWVVQSDGKVVGFGDATFLGDETATKLSRPIVGIN